MPREAIAEERYFAEIERLLNEGVPLENITATKVQQAVGGRYNRAAEIVEGYKTEVRQRQQKEQEIPVASWFKEAVNLSVSEVEGHLNGLWLTLHEEMNKIIVASREGFEKDKVEQGNQLAEARKLIDELETRAEELESVIQEQKSTIAEQSSNLEHLQADNEKLKADNKRITSEYRDVREQVEELLKKVELKTTETGRLTGKVEQIEKEALELKQKNKQLEQENRRLEGDLKAEKVKSEQASELKKLIAEVKNLKSS